VNLLVYNIVQMQAEVGTMLYCIQWSNCSYYWSVVIPLWLKIGVLCGQCP